MSVTDGLSEQAYQERDGRVLVYDPGDSASDVSGVTSSFHSLSREKANGNRELVLTPFPTSVMGRVGWRSRLSRLRDLTACSNPSYRPRPS
jgi:hypothetical protein